MLEIQQLEETAAKSRTCRKTPCIPHDPGYFKDTYLNITLVTLCVIIHNDPGILWKCVGNRHDVIIFHRH